MKVNISDLMMNESIHKKIELNENFENIEFSGETIKLVEPVRVSGEITAENGLFRLNGFINAVVELNCHRCAKEVTHKLDIPIYEGFSQLESSAEDYYLFAGKEIDLTNMVTDNIISSIPMKVLCSENCKGLCSICGNDRNLKECNCKQQDYDSRFEILSKLKK